MIDLITSIVNVISSLIGFIIHSIESLFNLLTHIPTYVSFLTVSIGYLPTMVIPFAIASISIYVVFLVLNRGK